MAIMRSDFGSLQVLETGAHGPQLRLMVARGFPAEAEHFWGVVRSTSTCSSGSALRLGERFMCSDVTADPSTSEEDLAMYRRVGLVAVQATPLVTRGGRLLGTLDPDAVRARHPGVPEIRVAVTGNGTLSALLAPLTAETARHGLLLNPLVTGFDSYVPELATAGSDLHLHRPDLVLCLLDHRAVLDRLPVPWRAPDVAAAWAEHLALVKGLAERFTANGGRTLVLFTSHQSLQQTYLGIKPRLEKAGIAVLAQRIDGAPRRLIERMRLGGPVVVLGAATFWEGVDIAGPALSALAIVRLPFAVPTDPVIAARSELYDNAFTEYSVPQAILRFRQGFGRLIRSRGDRGIVVVLDRRIRSRAYGRTFLKSLPECEVRDGPMSKVGATARDWLATTAAST